MGSDSGKEMNSKSLLEEACKIVYLNYGNQTAQLYKAGLKDKAEKEIYQSLEQSLEELVGPANAREQLKGIKEKFGNIN
jgi:hypothetical protein